MSADVIQQLKGALNTLVEKIKYTITNSKVNTHHADDSDHLNNRTSEQVITAIKTPVTDHADERGVVHSESADIIGMYTKDEVDSELSDLMSTDILPISMYGSQGYIPPNISGSFEGSANRAFDGERHPMYLEKDGSLIILRQGTNGATSRVYYTYIPDALSPGDLNHPINTNKVYRPSFIPEGKHVFRILAWGETIIYGILIDDHGNTSDHFMAYTNNTFDDRYHVGIIISRYQLDRLQIPAEFCIVGDLIYRVDRPYYQGKNDHRPLTINLYTMPLSVLFGEEEYSWTQLDGITTYGFHNHVAVDKDTIELAQTVNSTDPSNNPMILLVEGSPFISMNVTHSGGAICMISSSEDEDALRIKFVSTIYYTTRFGGTNRHLSFSFTYDIKNKIARLDDSCKGPNIIRSSEDSAQYFFDTVITSIATEAPYDGVIATSNGTRTSYLTKEGYWFMLIRLANTNNMSIRRSRIDQFQSKFINFERAKTRVFNLSSSRAVTSVFGSALGTFIASPSFISENKIISLVNGTSNDGTFATYELAMSTLTGSSNDYVHLSINIGTIKGYVPSTERFFLNDYISRAQVAEYMHNVYEKTSNSYTVSGYNFVEDYTMDSRVNNRPRYVYEDLTTSDDRLNVDNNILQYISDTVLNTAPILANNGVVTSILSQLIIPQTTMCTPIALTVAVTSNGNAYTFLSDITISSIINSNIEDITIGATQLIDSRTNGRQLSVRTHTNATRSMSAGIHIYETGDHYLFAINAAINIAMVGSTAKLQFLFAFDKNANKYIYDYMRVSAYAGEYAITYFVHPTEGICEGLMGESITDGNNKCVYRPIAKTFNDLVNWSVPSADTHRVLLTSEILDAWSIFITDQQPVILKGKAYDLSPRTFNLTDITSSPANSEFYLYVELQGSQAQYVLLEDQLEDTFERMWIGTITTGPTGVTSIYVDRVFRIDTFRITTSPGGQSIPVISGHPSQLGQTTWS